MRRRTTLAILICFVAAQGHAKPANVVWYDLELDSTGRVVDSILVSDVNPAIGRYFETWIKELQFDPAKKAERAVPSTTSIWIEFDLIESSKGAELKIREYEAGPRLKRGSEPVYPIHLYEHEGWVRLEFIVTAAGRIRSLNVIESSHRAFEEAAFEAVRDWRFVPRTADGEPIDTHVVKELRFEPRKPG